MKDTWANKRPKLTANNLAIASAASQQDQVMVTDKEGAALVDVEAEAANDNEDDAA